MTTIRVKKKHKRRQRRKKLHHLRHRIEETKDLSARRRLIEKIHRISSRAPVPER